MMQFSRSLFIKTALLLFSTALLAATPTASNSVDDVFSHPTDGKTLLTTTLQAPAKRLATTQVMQGGFIHRKHLSEIPQPLISNGEFIFARELGVHWHTKSPFESVFVLTQNGLIQRDEGAETLRLSANEQPAVRVIASVFFALFTLDVDALEKNFTLFGQADKSTTQRWTIGLRPKSSAIASVFKEALVIGGADVESIVLIDKRGDRTEIELRNVQYSPAAPSADIKSLFNEKRQ